MWQSEDGSGVAIRLLWGSGRTVPQLVLICLRNTQYAISIVEQDLEACNARMQH